MKKIVLFTLVVGLGIAQAQAQPTQLSTNSTSPTSNISLKFILPPEELKIIEQKKLLEAKMLELRLMQNQLQEEKLRAELEATKALTEMKIKTYKRLESIVNAKLKELQIADFKTNGIVGNVVITPNLAIQNGTEIGKGLKLVIAKKKVLIKDNKGNYLVVPIQTSNPEELVQKVSTSINQANKIPQTFKLLSGEEFRRR